MPQVCFCTPGRCPAILMTATRWALSSKPLRGSPAARSSLPVSTRDTGATMPQTAVGYNLRLVLAWLRIILRAILLALLQTFTIRTALNRLLNGRLPRRGLEDALYLV